MTTDLEQLRKEFLNGILTADTVICELENGDEVSLWCTDGEYSDIGEVAYLHLIYAEYREGGWSEEDPNDHHFMGGPSLYFHLDHVNEAVDAAVQYALKLGRTVNPAFRTAVTLEEVAERLDRGFSWKWPEVV